MLDTGPSIDILGVFRGCIGGVLGINDWDLSRSRDVTEIVIYICGSRENAHNRSRELKRTREMTMRDVDRHYGTSVAVELGAGKPPSMIAMYPIKVVVKAEHGFTLDPIRAFERAVELIEAGAWDQHPGCRPAPRSRAKREVREYHDDHEEAGPQAGRLGASPKIDAEGGRSYKTPQFKQQVRGYERSINPNSWGTDEHGYPTLGRTYVPRGVRGENRKEKPGVVYVKDVKLRAPVPVALP